MTIMPSSPGFISLTCLALLAGKKDQEEVLVINYMRRKSMEKKKAPAKNTSSRREILKKVGTTAAFVVPTIMTFKKSELAVAASNVKPPGTPGPY